MSQHRGFPRYSTAAESGEAGVRRVANIVAEDLRWIFKRNHQEHDFGIDGQVEIVSDTGYVTGQAFAVQIKHGQSYHSNKTRFGYVYRGELKHFNYLCNYPLPVFLILSGPDTTTCRYVRFDRHKTSVSRGSWTITIPTNNLLATNRAQLLAELPKAVDALSDLDEYWAINNIATNASYVMYVCAFEHVRACNVAPVREFVDRLMVTRELAYEMRGKVDFTIDGYEGDPREVFEIPEAKAFFLALSGAIPELFLFSSTALGYASLHSIAACASDARAADPPRFVDGRMMLIVDPQKLAIFAARHFQGLNVAAKWLGLTDEELRTISLNIINVLGLSDGNPAKPE